jgi:hypothetical protein
MPPIISPQTPPSLHHHNAVESNSVHGVTRIFSGTHLHSIPRALSTSGYRLYTSKNIIPDPIHPRPLDPLRRDSRGIPHIQQVGSPAQHVEGIVTGRSTVGDTVASLPSMAKSSGMVRKGTVPPSGM